MQASLHRKYIQEPAQGGAKTMPKVWDSPRTERLHLEWCLRAAEYMLCKAATPTAAELEVLGRLAHEAKQQFLASLIADGQQPLLF